MSQIMTLSVQMKYLDYLIVEYLNLEKTAKGRKYKDNFYIYFDSYKIDAITFIKGDYSFDFILPLDTIQLTREALKGLIEDIDLGIYKSFDELIFKSSDYSIAVDAIENIYKHYPKLFENTSIINFASNLRGLLIFFQQLFRIRYAKEKDKTARYFVAAHPELVSHYITNPESLVFVSREITPVESINQTKPPEVKLVNNQALIIYPRYTSPNKIKTEIRRRIKTYGLKSYYDITPILLILDRQPEIFTTYKNIIINKQKAKLTIPTSINPHLLLQVMNELIYGNKSSRT